MGDGMMPLRRAEDDEREELIETIAALDARIEVQLRSLLGPSDDDAFAACERARKKARERFGEL